MAHVPAELLYTKSHEWVQFTGETTARVGITDFAQNSLGDIVFVNLPAEGDGVTAVRAPNIGNTEPSENSQGKGGDLRSKYYPTLTVVRKT